MQIAAEALMRAHGMASKSPFVGFKVGAAPDEAATVKWLEFLDAERLRAEELLTAFPAHKSTTCFADVVRSAADYEGELPIPTQGLPDFSQESVAKAMYPEPPAPLLLEWLVKTTPQRIPNGYENIALRDCGRYLADLSLVLKQFEALRKDYVRTFGDFALVKQQQQPLSKRQQLALLDACRTYSVPGWSVERNDG
eukprot:2771098-Prymnesium_polylepis.1